MTAVTGERRDVSLDLSPGAQRTEVYDSMGEKMGILRYDVDRELVTLATIPAEAIETFLAVEDDKFWLHNGVDLRATVRAMISNVAAGGINQGGSTITQQIVKLRVVGNERSFNRKIREVVQSVFNVSYNLVLEIPIFNIFKRLHISHIVNHYNAIGTSVICARYCPKPLLASSIP